MKRLSPSAAKAGAPTPSADPAATDNRVLRSARGIDVLLSERPNRLLVHYTDLKVWVNRSLITTFRLSVYFILWLTVLNIPNKIVYLIKLILEILEDHRSTFQLTQHTRISPPHLSQAGISTKLDRLRSLSKSPFESVDGRIFPGMESSRSVFGFPLSPLRLAADHAAANLRYGRKNKHIVIRVMNV